MEKNSGLKNMKNSMLENDMRIISQLSENQKVTFMKLFARLAAANGVVVAMQCEYYAMEGLRVITDVVRRLREGANPEIHLEGILMTMHDARTNLSEDVVQEVRKHFGKLVYKTVIPRNIRISEAPSFGQPVVEYDPASKGAQAYVALAKEFAARAARGQAQQPETP